MDDLRGPTNSAGLTTVFEHRAWELWCEKHDRPNDGGSTIGWCDECVGEYVREREDHKSRRRVRELREALRPLIAEQMQVMRERKTGENGELTLLREMEREVFGGVCE